jgi:hypothetical protein
MRYEKPEFVEIKMDAEIGSYQSDFGDRYTGRMGSASPTTSGAEDKPQEVASDD